MTGIESLDLNYLIRTAQAAGEAILEVYETDFEVARKSDASPVTEADLQAHQIIVQRLKEGYPDIPILSEESVHQVPYEVRRGWEYFWMVDPLDGTKEFIKRNGQFTVNIALIEQSRPRAGVVYAPALDLCYYGRGGEGAFKVEDDGEPHPLMPPAEHNGDRLVIAGSVSHPTPEMEAFVEEQRAKHKEVEFIAMGSSLKICLVAEGRADIYPRFGPTMEWDTAAAHAIVNAAGRRILRWGTDEELSYNKPKLKNHWFVVC